MAEVICLSCQHFTPLDHTANKLVSNRWKGICGHKDLEEANLIDTVHSCRVYLRIVYPTRLEKVLKDDPCNS